jgi:uncharacterized phage protein (TIGR02216 family)
MSGFDWPAMMQFGIHELGLKPHEFWSLTPLELLLISGFSGRKTATISRADLIELCSQFPDDDME